MKSSKAIWKKTRTKVSTITVRAVGHPPENVTEVTRDISPKLNLPAVECPIDVVAENTVDDVRISIAGHSFRI